MATKSNLTCYNCDCSGPIGMMAGEFQYRGSEILPNFCDGTGEYKGVVMRHYECPECGEVVAVDPTDPLDDNACPPYEKYQSNPSENATA